MNSLPTRFITGYGYRICPLSITCLLTLVVLACFPVVGLAGASEPATRPLAEPRLGSYFYINHHGVIAFPEYFEQALAFHDGIANVRLTDRDAKGNWTIENYQFGAIDTKGGWVVTPTGATVGVISEGMIRVSNKKEGRYYVDSAGAIVLNLGKSIVGAGDFHEGLACILRVTSEGEKHGFVNRAGTIVVPAIYDIRGGDFSEGLASVGIVEQGKEKYGFVDHYGNMTIPMNFSEAWSFREGLAVAKSPDNGLYGFIDHAGKWAIKPQFKDVDSFSEGTAAVSVSNDGVMKWGMVDKSGTILFLGDYDSLDSLHCGLAIFGARAAEGGKLGFLDRNGKVIIEAAYSGAGKFSEGLAAVRQTGKDGSGNGYGYIDTRGRMVIPFQFEQAREFHDGLAAVKSHAGK